MDVKNSPEYKNFVRKIRVTGVRLALISFLYWMLIGIMTAAALASIYLIIDRIFYPIPITVYIIMPILVAIVLAFGLFGFFKKFPTKLSTAIRIDEYLKSDERISSAFLVNGENNFEQALIAESMMLLKTESVSGMLKKNFRKITAISLSCLGVAALIFFFMPSIHYFVEEKQDHAIAGGNLFESVRILSQSSSEYQRLKKAEDTMEETAKLLDDYEELKNRLKTAMAEKNQLHNPEKQKELLSELSNFRDKIKKVQDELKKLKKDTDRLKNKGVKDSDTKKNDFEKKMDELEDKLSEGNFKDFTESTKNLLDQIKESENAQDLKQQLAEKMKELSEQFSNQQMQDMLDQLSENLDNFNPNDLTNQQMQDLLDSMQDFGDMTKLMNNQELLDLLQNQLGKAQDKMTGG